MSTNLLYNPKFDLPLITTNSFKYYTNLTTEEKTNFYWTVGANNYISLQNGISAFNYASPSLLNLIQAVSFQYDSAISQTVTILDLVTYQLRFNYTCRAAYAINPLNVYFNDVLTYTVSTYTASWSEVIIDYVPTDFGDLTIKFETISDGQDRGVCFTNIKFFQKNVTEGGGGPGITSKIVTYNSLKNTNIYGGLNVYNLNLNGVNVAGVIRAPKLILNNIDTTTSLTTIIMNTSRINYNYTTIQGNIANSLGHLSTSNYVGSSVAANVYANIALVNLNPGVYLIDAYALFNITTINNVVRLGMNTVINTVNTAYNYSSLFVSNISQQNIKYTYVLRNTTAAPYYIFYHSASATTTLTKFQVNVLRIA